MQRDQYVRIHASNNVRSHQRVTMCAVRSRRANAASRNPRIRRTWIECEIILNISNTRDQIHDIVSVPDYIDCTEL